MRTYDIKIGDLALMFPEGEQRGIELGVAPAEPGSNGQVDSVVITSFHGGIGRTLDDGIMRYKEGTNIDATVPGMLGPTYADVAVGNFTDTDRTRHLPVFMQSFAGSVFYVVSGRTIKRILPAAASPTLDTVTITGAFGAGEELTGSGFQYNADTIMGVATTGFVGSSYLIGSGTSFTRDTGKGINAGASTRARSFWTEGASVALYWAPMISGATFDGGGSFREFGPIHLGDGDSVNWLSMLGTQLVIFRADGSIYGADETGLISLAGKTPASDFPENLTFGRRAQMYLDSLLIPSVTGLWAFDPQSLTTRAVGPNFVQNTGAEALRGEVTGIGAMGPYAFVGQRIPGGTNGKVRQIVRTGTLTAVHDIIGALGSNEIATDFLVHYVPSERRFRLYYTVFNTSTEQVTVYYRPLRTPTDQFSSSTGLNSTGTLKLSKLAGQNASLGMTKLWVQVRGHFEKGSGASAKLRFSNVTIDGQTVAVADVTASGPFAQPITASGNESRLVGREMDSCDIALIDPGYDTRVECPLIFDYIWVPDTKDAITLNVVIGSETSGRVASSWLRNAKEATDALLALRGTVTTVTFPDAAADATPWNVLVQDVQIVTAGEPQPGSYDRIAKVICRRL